MVLEPFVRKPLPALEFARVAFDVAERLSSQQFFRRDEPGVQLFLEEVLPIAAFAKSWEKPERRLTIEYFGKDHPFDALVSISGRSVQPPFLEPTYHLEVTSAIFHNEHLERRALDRYGSVFIDPNIHRTGSSRRGDDRIISVATAQDGDTPVLELTEWVNNAITRKAASEYPQPSLLLIRAEPSRPLSLGEWCSVVAATTPTAAVSRFSFVVVVDWSNGIAHTL